MTLPNPVMTASGTSGHADELGRYFDLSALGAVVVKSLSASPWAGNPAPRLHETDAGMLNSVGLQNPGVEAWLADELPALVHAGARVVASIWGFTVEDFALAAKLLVERATCGDRRRGQRVVPQRRRPSPDVRALDVGYRGSDRRHGACDRPRWAKLSPNVTDLVEIADAALRAGADALTLTNTVMGMAIDPETRRPRLGAGGGGLSGPAIRPVAVRAIYECREAFPAAAIVGVGGVATGEHAVELLLAGANAVEVGTATFYDPRTPLRVVHQLERWCDQHGVRRVPDLIGAAHE